MRKIFLTTLVLFFSACSFQSDSGDNLQVKSSAHTPEEMQAAWEKAMTPAEEHKLLQELSGNWDAKVRFWTQADTAPKQSTAKSTHKSILSGKFLVEDYQGSFEGHKFQGMGITGFDTVLGKFNHYWIDNMGTGSILSEGTYDPETKTISMQGSVTDPVSKQKRKTASVTRIIDGNNHVFEMYDVLPGGKKVKTLEISYVRAAS